MPIRNKRTGRRYWDWDEALGWESHGDFEEMTNWGDEKVNVQKELGGIIKVRVERFGFVEEEKTFFSQEEAKRYLRWREWR
jgi:hypothetical protein